MNNLPLPALLAVRHKEEEAFKRAMNQNILSEISTREDFIENYNYVVTCPEFHWFQNIFDNGFIKCKI